MTQVVYVDGSALLAPAIRESRLRLRHVWRGWDGSEWDLSQVDGRVVMMAGDVEGLDDLDVDLFTTEAAAVPGSRFRGARDKAREVYWPIMVQGDTVEEYLANREGFRRTLHPRRPGVWTVTRPDGRSRSITLYYRPDPMAYSRDPLPEEFEVGGVNFLALDPYWRGAPVPRTFQIGVDTQPFIPPGGGPPLHIAQASTTADATINNDGDEPASLTWKVTAGAGGIAAGMVLAIGDAELGVVPDLDAGDVLVIDTAPNRQTTTLNGTRIRGILSPHEFGAVPPGGTTTLTIEATGVGVVEATLVPLHRRAF